ncbi:MAG: VOC family protein [Planctomycetes bacterium]|nr:VOC family protein [Planctomycetota bacterium]
MTNPVCYFEIPVADLDRAVAFYRAVFGCDFERVAIDGNAMALFPSDTASSGASGALARGDSYVPGRQGVRVYFRVSDVVAALTRAVAAGGHELYPPTTVPGYGRVAEFADSEGNCVALFAPEGQDAKPGAAADGGGT